MNKTAAIIILAVVVAFSTFVWLSSERYDLYFPKGVNAEIFLNLSGKNLSRIPEYVFSRTELQELDVSNNKLTGAIQAEIRHLKNLKILRAGNNEMTGVPAEIGQLQKLEILDLSNNLLTGLPQELGNLKNLKILNLSGNQYSQQDLNYIRSRLPATTQIITK